MSGRLRPVPEPAHSRLEEIARELERTGWAFEVVDADWRLVWLSEQLKLLVGVQDDEALGVGRHVLETRQLEAWEGVITDESEDCWGSTHLPFILHHDPSAGDLLPEDVAARIGPATPAPPPSLWTFDLRFTRGQEPMTRVSCAGVALREDGRTLGYAMIYGPATPASCCRCCCAATSSSTAAWPGSRSRAACRRRSCSPTSRPRRPSRAGCPAVRSSPS